MSGHFLHDFIANQYIKTHDGHFEPEVRLRAIFISTPFILAGLVGLGYALEDAYHYMVTSLFWGLYVFGIMIATVALNAYNLDSYPEASGEVASWINFSRTTGGECLLFANFLFFFMQLTRNTGFIISYFQVKWANSSGTKVSFGTQAGICAGAFLIIVATMVYGKRLRLWSGPLKFTTS